MSFEGYYRMLCENGHLTSAEAIGFNDPEEEPCIICQKKIVWWEIIDMTNGSDEANPETKLEIKKKAKIIICPTCNRPETITECTYKIPTK